MTDLREAHAKGFISKTPHFNTIFNYLEDKNLTPILRELITRSSLPLKAIETDFAVDSSGFSTSRFVRWFDQKYGDASRAARLGQSASHVSAFAPTSSPPSKSATGTRPTPSRCPIWWT